MTTSTGNPQEPARLTIRIFRKEDAPADFERAIRIRTEVFVEEQGISLEEELDEYDDEAIHWLIVTQSEEAVATGRMIAYQEGCQMRPVAKIGRIAVKKAMRGLRLGDLLMREILRIAAEDGYGQAILDAQTRVLPFYEKLGFVAEGDEFMDANIPHYRMRKLLS
jgi:predicted GNAT family N-acyltransferase